MSDQPNEKRLTRHRRASVLSFCLKALCLAFLFGCGLLSPTVHGETFKTNGQSTPPMLVRARQGDTPASLAQRYLNDAGKGWMISEYNGRVSFSDGQAVIIPTRPFRLGGLTPAGYQTVPVLAYTTIGNGPGLDAPVSRTAFEEQMSWLNNGGFTVIKPSQLIDFMNFSGQLPRHAVLITADTESLAFFDQAVPILDAFGFTATLFVATELVGQSGNMTWDQLRQLSEAGYCVGSRGREDRLSTRRRSGASLKNDFSTIEADLRRAKQTVEHHLGTACTVLAYPDSHTNDLIAAIAAKLGFSAAFVQSAGENPFFGSRFAIHRLVIDSRVGPGQFTEMLTTTVAVDLF